MARTVRDPKLDSRKARESLKQQREPYWRAIDRGAHIGYRKGQQGGSWIARLRADDGKYKFTQIGKADDIQDADGVGIIDFSQAQQKARAWFASFKRQERGVGSAGYTVNDALDDYLVYLKDRKSYERSVYSVKSLIRPALGKFEVAKLTSKQIVDWHKKLADDKPRLRVKEGEKSRYKEIEEETSDYKRRRKSSANRTLTILKAALNLAFQEGKIASKDAWERAKPFKGVDNAKIRYLSQSEAVRLVNACEPEFRKLVQAALLTGCRYGEITRLQASDYNRDSGTLHIRESKGGRDRHVTLTDEGRKFFDSLTAGKSGHELVFPKGQGNGKEVCWGASHQIRPLNQACRKAKISPAITFHILRHTHASWLAVNKTPMPVIAAQLGHRDTRITERHYAHLSPGYVTDTIRANFPGLKIAKDSNIIAIDNGKKRS